MWSPLPAPHARKARTCASCRASPAMRTASSSCGSGEAARLLHSGSARCACCSWQLEAGLLGMGGDSAARQSMASSVPTEVAGEAPCREEVAEVAHSVGCVRIRREVARQCQRVCSQPPCQSAGEEGAVAALAWEGMGCRAAAGE